MNSDIKDILLRLKNVEKEIESIRSDIINIPRKYHIKILYYYDSIKDISHHTYMALEHIIGAIMGINILDDDIESDYNTKNDK